MALRHTFPLLVVGAASLALLLVLSAFDRSARHTAEVDASARMERELALGTLALQSLGGVEPGVQAERLAAITGLRVTLIAVDGTVLADSHLAPQALERLESHANRPEVIQAVRGESAQTRRLSFTLGEEFLYGARAVETGSGVLVLRLGRSAADIRPPPTTARQGLLLAAALGLLLSFLLAVLMVRSIHAPLERVTLQLRRLGQGEFGARVPRVTRIVELRQLAAASNRLAEEVESRLVSLARERDEMQGLVDAIGEGVIALTEDARVLRMNRAAANLLGISNPVPFAPVGSLIRHPELRDLLEASVIRPRTGREIQIGDRHLLVTPRLLESGGSVVVFVDVTELRRMEQVRRDFVANASHELKTPLTSMRGFAETLLDGDPPEELRRQFLTSIRTNTLRLQALVDDLLDLSRLESGGWEARIQEVDLASTAVETWEEFLSQQKGVGIEFGVEGDVLALGDENAVSQIFRNLLDNALRYTPEGGTITVRIEEEGPVVRTSVTDSGTGIPSTAHSRIFERFYRVDPARARDRGGTGLGLAIVRHLVNTMRGEVGVVSALGEGTTIHFTLPAADA